MKCDFCLVELEHPRRTICAECERKWNIGAALADAHWADTPQEREQDMQDIGGRNIRTTEATHRAMSRIAKEKPE